MLLLENSDALTTPPAADPAEVLIVEVHRVTRRRWRHNGVIALVLVLAAGAMVIGVAGGSDGSVRLSNGTVGEASPASFPLVSTALASIPATLRQALLKTMASSSFVEGPVVYEAPDRLGPPPGHKYEQPCATGSGGSSTDLRSPPTIVGTTEYLVYESCPGAKLSTETQTLSNGQFGLSPAQSLVFGLFISALQGSVNFRHGAQGYSWEVSDNAFPGQGAGVSPYRNVPGRAVIHDGRVTALVLYTRMPSGKLIQGPANFSSFNNAPKVSVPKVA